MSLGPDGLPALLLPPVIDARRLALNQAQVLCTWEAPPSREPRRASQHGPIQWCWCCCGWRECCVDLREPGVAASTVHPSPTGLFCGAWEGASQLRAPSCRTTRHHLVAAGAVEAGVKAAWPPGGWGVAVSTVPPLPLTVVRLLLPRHGHGHGHGHYGHEGCVQRSCLCLRDRSSGFPCRSVSALRHKHAYLVPVFSISLGVSL